MGLRCEDPGWVEKESCDFPDELLDYLAQPLALLPEKLRGFMDGSWVLPEKPTAIDPMPKTGKTKPRGSSDERR